MSQHWLGLGKDRSLALAQPPAVLIWHWANFWEGWRTEDWPCVCVCPALCAHTKLRPSPKQGIEVQGTLVWVVGVSGIWKTLNVYPS